METPGIHRVQGLWTSPDHTTGGFMQMLPNLGREASSQTLSTLKLKSEKENVVWLSKCDTNYSHLCKLLSSIA